MEQISPLTVLKSERKREYMIKATPLVDLRRLSGAGHVRTQDAGAHANDVRRDLRVIVGMGRCGAHGGAGLLSFKAPTPYTPRREGMASQYLFEGMVMKLMIIGEKKARILWFIIPFHCISFHCKGQRPSSRYVESPSYPFAACSLNHKHR